MRRLTEETWRNLDPWECCGQDQFCGRSCHDLGGCTNGCIVPKLYARLAVYEDAMPLERVQELVRAEKDGRLAVQEHGLWETHLLPLAWKCSVCGFKNSFRAGKSTEYLNYCPNCGTRMDAEDYRRKLEEVK